MLNLAIVICNSGLGHTKRVLYVLEKIIEKKDNLAITIIVDLKKLKHFPFICNNIQKKHKLNLIHVEADISNFEKEVTSKYRNNLKLADLVWSDNATFPLVLNDNVVITGSFLWGDELGGAYAERELSLLDQKNPVMIGCDYFATSSVKEKTRFNGVGIYNYAGLERSKYGKGDKVLVAVGNTPGAHNIFDQSMREVLESYSEEVEIGIDGKLSSLVSITKSVKLERFSRRGITGYASAVIRPGLGTVCDLWSTGAVVYPLLESTSKEMVSNKERVISIQGVGDSSTLNEAFVSAINIVSNRTERDKVVKKLGVLDYDGIERTAELICELI